MGREEGEGKTSDGDRRDWRGASLDILCIFFLIVKYRNRNFWYSMYSDSIIYIYTPQGWGLYTHPLPQGPTMGSWSTCDNNSRAPLQGSWYETNSKQCTKKKEEIPQNYHIFAACLIPPKTGNDQWPLYYQTSFLWNRGTPDISNTFRYLHKFYFPEASQASPGSQVYIIYTWDVIIYVSVDILI